MTSTLNADSVTLSPLPGVLSHGLVAVSTFGLLSFCCSTSLFFYLSYRLISWRKSGKEAPTNQFLILIYNLLFADIQQSLAFLLNINTLRNNAILVGTPACFAQGWFVSTGDLASSVFICAIAVHTFLAVVKEYRLPSKAFYSIIALLWTFVYVMAIIGPAKYGPSFYVRASAWCWINSQYDSERLWLHYFWIFAFMFGTILIYAIIFAFLQYRSRSLQVDASVIHDASVMHGGATPLMILYPAIYTVCTVPLAAGRIAALAGHDISLGYFCFAGSMIACNGWLDVLLYASTRAEIVFSPYPPGEETGLETFAFMGKGHKLGTTTTIHASNRKTDRERDGDIRLAERTRKGSFGSASAERLYGLDKIEVKGEIFITSDAAHPDDFGERRLKGVLGGSDNSATWDSENENMKIVYSCRECIAVTGVGLYNDPDAGDWIAPLNFTARWDDAGYNPPTRDQIGVIRQHPVNGRYGFPFHEACWSLLEKAHSPEPVPCEALFEICRSLPFPSEGSGLSWGHDFEGLVLVDNQDRYPWEDRFVDRDSHWALSLGARNDPYHVPEIQQLPREDFQAPPAISFSGQVTTVADCFAALPEEIRIVIASNLPTVDALNTRRASRSFLAIFYSQQFWAPRFRANADRTLRGIEFHHNTEDVPIEYRKLGRYKSSEYAKVIHFSIDGPGGEVIDAIEVYLRYYGGENVFWFYKHEALESFKPWVNNLDFYESWEILPL
ncbi:hypothetical protein B7494_g6174 [Chlorociboria aeruginascens]|nr:hypothetical protein B7494_g6174 [Chlorociboria aeruginascens]